MAFARTAAARGFTRFPTGMSVAVAVVCTGYFYPGRTSSFPVPEKPGVGQPELKIICLKTFIDNSVFTSYPSSSSLKR